MHLHYVRKPKVKTRTRPRVKFEGVTEKQKRREYLARRALAFQAEQEKADAAGLGWKTVSCVMLERLPVVVPDFTDWELDMWNLQIKQAAQGADIPKELNWADETLQPRTLQQATRACPIRLAPRRTKADRENDRTSLDRALAHSLYLIAPNPGETADVTAGVTAGGWRFISGEVHEGETLREAAERVTYTALGRRRGVTAAASGSSSTSGSAAATESKSENDDVELYFVGNCPAGWAWKVLPEAERERQGVYGRKEFFSRCQLISGGSISLDPKLYRKHVWVTKEELAEYFGHAQGEYLAKIL